jgi:hypothetical protein
MYKARFGLEGARSVLQYFCSGERVRPARVAALQTLVVLSHPLLLASGPEDSIRKYPARRAGHFFRSHGKTLNRTAVRPSHFPARDQPADQICRGICPIDLGTLRAEMHWL